MDEIEDLVQDTFCAVLEAYGRFNGRSTVKTWIFGISRIVLLNHLYGKERSHRLMAKLKLNQVDRSSTDLFYLRWAGDRLKPAQKKLFYDFYRDAMPIKSIADQRRVPEGTIKYQLYQLRGELKRMLNRG